jgi:hypothetical protein
MKILSEFIKLGMTILLSTILVLSSYIMYTSIGYALWYDTLTMFIVSIVLCGFIVSFGSNIWFIKNLFKG